MIKCPNCGSSAQVKLFDDEFEDDPCGAIRYKTYLCGCGHLFTTRTYYEESSNEIIDDPNV